MEGCGHGLLQKTIPASTWQDCRNSQKTSGRLARNCRDSNWVPPEQNCVLHQAAWHLGTSEAVHLSKYNPVCNTLLSECLISCSDGITSLLQVQRCSDSMQTDFIISSPHNRCFTCTMSGEISKHN